MELKVKDVFANWLLYGTATKQKINKIWDGNGCKKRAHLGDSNCTNNFGCRNCFEQTLSEMLLSEKNAREHVFEIRAMNVPRYNNTVTANNPALDATLRPIPAWARTTQADNVTARPWTMPRTIVAQNEYELFEPLPYNETIGWESDIER